MSGVREFLLAFADDEHLMGQQHTEWIGVAPFLEEDLAFASIGQDELGHAALLYELVLELDGAERTDAAVDALAYRRSSGDYRSCHLVERTTADWAEALVRHWVYDTFEAMRWQLVADSSLLRLRAVAERARREEAFHRLHADALLDRLLPSPDARRRILAGLDTIAPLVPGLCEATAGEADAIRAGVASGSTADLAEPLARATVERFGEASGPAPARALARATEERLSPSSEAGATDHESGPRAPARAGTTNGGDRPAGPSPELSRTTGAAANGQRGRTRRSADFEPLMARMREVLDFDPEAVW